MRMSRAWERRKSRRVSSGDGSGYESGVERGPRDSPWWGRLVDEDDRLDPLSPSLQP